jgi:hypothetical protein
LGKKGLRLARQSDIECSSCRVDHESGATTVSWARDAMRGHALDPGNRTMLADHFDYRLEAPFLALIEAFPKIHPDNFLKPPA